jgi:glycosyltransferase involved in cell wall biosynthesis
MTGPPGAGTSAGGPILWIDWDRHLRTRTLVQRLAIELLEISLSGNRIRRYWQCTIRTVAAIRRTRPEIVIATNPSLVLAFLLLALRRFYGFALVSDAHYVGVRAMHDHRFVQKLLDFYNSRIDLVIVTNDVHARYLAAHGCRVYVCPDPLPRLPAAAATVPVPAKSVLLVCSFDSDEPYDAVFTAFSSLREAGYSLFVSGNYRKAHIEPSAFPWVNFLGFLSEDDYYAYLRSCAVIMDLTTLEDCLVCGAYEAFALQKPLVLSRTRALAEYFGAAAVLTDNTPQSIIENVQAADARQHELARKVSDWIAANERLMGKLIAGLTAELHALRRASAARTHKSATS